MTRSFYARTPGQTLPWRQTDLEKAILKTIGLTVWSRSDRTIDSTIRMQRFVHFLSHVHDAKADLVHIHSYWHLVFERK